MSHFPFTAVVGSDDLRLALVLSAVAPQIGGVLVRGEKGTAKSTSVRALASLLPAVEVVDGCRFSCDPTRPDPRCPDGPHHASAASSVRPATLVELPVGATEDRVIGSLDLHRALADGTSVLEPGLLAAAHRGVLYVDEVNLLHDHLVDVLLDAAAMGRSTIEREGMSVSHAARFVLVGTMNPEEGELRPQLLDRFGLTVEVAAPRDPGLRMEVVRRRLAFERDPGALSGSYASSEQRLAARIRAARAACDSVELGDDALLLIARVCAGFEVDGMRADIVTARTAVAHAAWCGRAGVGREDIRAAARLAIPHRRRRNPFDAPGLDEELLDELLGEEHDDEPPPPPPGGGEGPPPQAPADSAGLEPHPAERSTASGPAAPESTVGAGTPFATRTLTVKGLGTGQAGRRSRATTSTGRAVGSRPGGASAGPVHLLDTVRAAAPHQRSRGRAGTRLLVTPADVRLSVRQGRESNLVLFCVDASGSMAARRRMEEVKTAVLSLLMDAYRRRDKVGLVTFRGQGARVALPPTSSVDVAARRLAELPAGGRTPLCEGLLLAGDTLRRERLRDPQRRALLVVVTDGRATAGADPVRRAHLAAQDLAAAGVSSVVLDCETGRLRLGLARQLAGLLHAEHLPVGEVGASSLTAAVRGSAA